MKALTALILCFITSSISLEAQRSIIEIREYIKLHELKGDSCDSLVQLINSKDRTTAHYWYDFLPANLFLKEMARYEQYLLSRDTSNIYYSLDSALKNPDDVKWLDLSGSGLKRLPRSVLTLKNLEILDLTGLEILDFDSAQVPVARVDFSYKITNMDSSIVYKLYNLFAYDTFSIIDSHFSGTIKRIPNFVFQLPKLKLVSCFSCRNEYKIEYDVIRKKKTFLGGELDRLFDHSRLYNYPYVFVYPGDTLK